MRCDRFTKPTRMIAGLLSGLLFAISSVPLGAQPAPESNAQHASKPSYFQTHQITLNGTIQEVISKRVPGTPVGMHVLVAAPEGTVDAHLGPYLTEDAQEALHAGTPVQIVGAMETVNGKSYLLARQVIIGGRTVTVRNENGFLMQAHGPRGAHSRAMENKSENEINGGAR